MARRLFDFIAFDAQKQVTKSLAKSIEAVPKAMRRGARRAISRTLTTARKEASQAIRDDLALKSRDIKDRLEKKILWDFEGVLQIRDRRLPLIKFQNPKQTARPKRKRKGATPGGVKVIIYKRKGRQLIEGAFIAKGRKTGRLHVLKREEKARYPIKKLYGPSITNTALRHLPRILERTEPVFDKNLAHEINRALDKL